MQEMHQIIFDIDGTLLNSVQIDSECYIQAFSDVYNIELNGADWNDYTHVTDNGLAYEIFEKHEGHPPSHQEIDRLKHQFLKLLRSRIAEIREITGVREFLKTIEVHQEIHTSFATGAWEEAAILKLSVIDYKPSKEILTSSNEDHRRSEILKIAISKAEKKAINDNLWVTYVGDGLWDMKVAKEVNVDFIGIDFMKTGLLEKAGAENVLYDWTNIQQFFEWIFSKKK